MYLIGYFRGWDVEWVEAEVTSVCTVEMKQRQCES